VLLAGCLIVNMMEEELLSCVTDVVGRVEVRQKSSRYMLNNSTQQRTTGYIESAQQSRTAEHF